MGSLKDYRDIVAWRLAHQMSVRVDLFLACPDFRRYFKSCAQLGEAARTAPRHIEDGHARLKRRDFAQCVRLARRSEADVLNHLIDAHAQRLITTDELIINRRLARKAMRAAGGLIRYLESASDTASEERRAKTRRGANHPPQSRIPPPLSIGGGEDEDHHADPRHDRHQGVTRDRARRQQ